ncbi:MAG TPA: Flp pilus assembly protein CpaB [Actinomycetota bacterium]|nr:Flp pilus assembly protein CpaB [Actinomycetota bacterium]
MRRRRPRVSGVLVFLSLVLAASATLALRGHLARLEARAASTGPGVSVVVAASALSRGTVLAPSMVRLAEFPPGALQTGALSSVEGISGRSLAADVAAGEPITSLRLAPPGGPVAAFVPDGFRAVPVGVSLPAGALVPGDRVDVMATFVGPNAHTETVAGEVEVLTVLEGSTFEGGEGTTVYVVVTPETAERLAFAGVHGDLSIAVAPPP